MISIYVIYFKDLYWLKKRVTSISKRVVGIWYSIFLWIKIWKSVSAILFLDNHFRVSFTFMIWSSPPNAKFSWGAAFRWCRSFFYRSPFLIFNDVTFDWIVRAFELVRRSCLQVSGLGKFVSVYSNLFY